jgi:hypothetical protein
VAIRSRLSRLSRQLQQCVSQSRRPADEPWTAREKMQAFLNLVQLNRCRDSLPEDLRELVDVRAYDLSDEQAAQLADQLLSWFLNEFPKLRPSQASHQEPGRGGDRRSSLVR